MLTSELKDPLELWFNEGLLLPGQRPAPFLMHLSPADVTPELQFWNLLRAELHKRVKICSFSNLSQAGEIVVTPNNFSAYCQPHILPKFYKFRNQVLTSGRKLITFTGSREYKSKPGEVAFATATYRDSGEKSIATPGWMFDFGNNISPIEKPEIPTVGFVGATNYPGKLSSIVNALPFPEFAIDWMASNRTLQRNLDLRSRQAIATLVRTASIQHLRQAGNLKTAIIERNGSFFSASDEERNRQWQEYIQNLQDNAYILCVRGDENSSYRLYETMSAGRIPIIVDTNMKLPELGSIKWEEFSVIVPYSDLNRIGEIVQSFHDSLSSSDFEKICLRARAAYEACLPHNFIFNSLEKVNC